MNRKAMGIILLLLVGINVPVLAIIYYYRDTTYLATRPAPNVFEVELTQGNNTAKEGYIDDDQISLLWFVQVTDVHIKNTSDPEAREYAEFLNYSYNYLTPFSVIATGDLIRWSLHEEYWKIVEASPYGTDPVVHKYMETVGNHDRRGDYGAEAFLNYTRTGRLTGAIQNFFTVNMSRGPIEFALLDSTPYEANPRLFGGESCLDETDFAEYDQFLKNQPSDGTAFTFLHHSPIETWNLYTRPGTVIPVSFNQMTSQAGVDAVFFGHTHMEWTETVGDVVHVMGDRWADKYTREDFDSPVGNFLNIVAVDDGRVSFVTTPFTHPPHMLITNPGNPLFLDEKDPHQTTRVDPYVRALVFPNPNDPITDVTYQLDGGAWSPMTQYPGADMLYQSTNGDLPDDGRNHNVRVRVVQASGKVTYQDATSTANPERKPFWEIVFPCLLALVIGLVVVNNRDYLPLRRADGIRRRLTYAEKEKKRTAINTARGRPKWFGTALAVVGVSMILIPWGIFPLFKGLPGAAYSFMAFLPTGPIFYFESIEYAVPRILFVFPLLYRGIHTYRPKVLTLASLLLIGSAIYLVNFAIENFGILGLLLPGVYIDLGVGIALLITNLKNRKRDRPPK